MDLGAGAFQERPHRTQTRWTPELCAQLERCWLSGASFAAMRAQLGVSDQAIYMKARVLGLPQREPPSQWTEHVTDVLKQRWAEGRSASVIASEIGVTRSAVLGRVHRLGLPKRRVISTLEHRSGTERQQIRRQYKTAKQREYRAKVKAERERVPAWNGSLNLMFEQLEPGQCRFPSGDRPFVFCGYPVTIESSYCAHHHRLAYQPPKGATHERSSF